MHHHSTLLEYNKASFIKSSVRNRFSAITVNHHIRILMCTTVFLICLYTQAQNVLLNAQCVKLYLSWRFVMVLKKIFKRDLKKKSEYNPITQV